MQCILCKIIFGKFFTSTIIWYAFLYALQFPQKIFILAKSGCYTMFPSILPRPPARPRGPARQPIRTPNLDCNSGQEWLTRPGKIKPDVNRSHLPFATPRRPDHGHLRPRAKPNDMLCCTRSPPHALFFPLTAGTKWTWFYPQLKICFNPKSCKELGFHLVLEPESVGGRISCPSMSNRPIKGSS
jgi:hypothetical protein